MSDVTILGRPNNFDEPYQANGPAGRASDPAWLSLAQAADSSGRTVEELKRAIRAGELRAERRGRWRIHRGDLNEFLHRV